MSLLALAAVMVVPVQEGPGESRANEHGPRQPARALPTDLQPPPLVDEAEQECAPFEWASASDDDECWLQFGPYAWGVPDQAYINGFLSDTFVDFDAGVALIRAEIQELLPAGPEPFSVLFYEDDALGPDAYGAALAAEVAAGLIDEPVFTDSQSTFAYLIGVQDWDLIVAANQNGSSSASHPFDAPLAAYVCDGGKVIISDFRINSLTADEALLCAQTDFDGSKNWWTMTSASDLFDGELQLYNPGWGIATYGLETDAVVYAAFDEASSGVHDPSRNSLGLPVAATAMETFDEHFMLDESRTLYMLTWGLEFAWDGPSARFIETLSGHSDADGFDASRWHALSFRILQLYGDPLNPYGESQDLTVRLRDRNGHAADLMLADALQGPSRYAVPPGTGIGWKSIFETYRFPLGWFVSRNPNLDITRLKSISFVCDVKPTGRLFIDDIEFSAVMFDGDGDGAVELDDFAAFATALGGPEQAYADPVDLIFDFEADGDVDLHDFARFQMAFGDGDGIE